MPPLQELREARETTKASLKKLQAALTEKRSAGKTGADLWTEAEQKEFDTSKAEMARLNKEIDGEERAVDLTEFLNTANEKRNQQRGPDGKPKPGLNDPIPGGYGTQYGDVYADRDHARASQLAEEKRAFALAAWAGYGRDGGSLTDQHKSAVTELKVDLTSGNLQMKGLTNYESRSLRGIIGQTPSFESRQRGFEYLERRAVTYTANDSFIPKTLLNSFELMFHGYGGILPIVDLMITDNGDTIVHPGGNDLVEGRQVVEGVAVPGTAADPEMLSPTLKATLFDSDFVRISKQLLRNSPFDLAELLGRLMAERCARIIERKLIEGTRPTSFGGVISKAANGLNMASKSVVAYSEFKKLKYSVISNYRDNGTYIFHDETLGALAALVDGQGRDLIDVDSGKILGRPYQVTNYMSTPTQVAAGAGLPLAIFGDFMMLKARVVRNVNIERFNEKFAEFHQAAFLASREADADLMRGATDVNCPIKKLTGV